MTIVGTAGFIQGLAIREIIVIRNDGVENSLPIVGLDFGNNADLKNQFYKNLGALVKVVGDLTHQDVGNNLTINVMRPKLITRNQIVVPTAAECKEWWVSEESKNRVNQVVSLTRPIAPISPYRLSFFEDSGLVVPGVGKYRDCASIIRNGAVVSQFIWAEAFFPTGVGFLGGQDFPLSSADPPTLAKALETIQLTHADVIDPAPNMTTSDYSYFYYLIYHEVFHSYQYVEQKNNKWVKVGIQGDLSTTNRDCFGENVRQQIWQE